MVGAYSGIKLQVYWQEKKGVAFCALPKTKKHKQKHVFFIGIVFFHAFAVWCWILILSLLAFVFIVSFLLCHVSLVACTMSILKVDIFAWHLQHFGLRFLLLLLLLDVGCWILFLSAFLPNAAYTVQSTVFSFQNVANTVLIGATCRFYLQNAANTVYIRDVSVKCDNNTLPGHIYCNYSANERLKVQNVANICKCHPRYAF